MSKNNIYLIYGSEDFLIEEKNQEILKIHENKDSVLFSEKIDLKQLLIEANSLDLFSQEKIFLVKNPDFLNKKEENFELFEKIIEAILFNHHILIISATNGIDFRLKIPALLKKSATLFEFNAFKEWEQTKLITWLRNEFTKRNKKITESALIALSESSDNNLRELINEIEKIITYKANEDTIIELCDIKALTKGEKLSTFDLNEHFKKKDLKNSLKIILNLLKNNEDPLKILGLITSNLRLYLQILVYLSENKSIETIAGLLKKHSYYLKMMVNDIKTYYSVEKIKNYFEILNQKDLEIKTGKLKADQALILALTEILV